MGAELEHVSEHAEIRKVLLVDDHEVALKSLAREFVRAGIQPLKAMNRAQAMNLVAQESPDLAIIDLFLEPPENGLQLLSEIKSTEKPPFCILVSAHMTVAHAVLGMKHGADDVFLKPFTAGQVLHRVYGERPQLDLNDIPTLAQVEWEHISRVLGDYDGNITHAAEALGVFRQSLQRKIHKHAPRVLTGGETPPAPRTRRPSESDE